MVKATIEDSAFPTCSSKEHDAVRRRGCIEHTFGKEVGLGLNRGHHFSGSRAGVRSSAAAEKGVKNLKGAKPFLKADLKSYDILEKKTLIIDIDVLTGF